MTEFNRRFSLVGATALLMLATWPVRAGDDNGTRFLQTNLVSNVPGTAANFDAALQNSWGVANFPDGPLWINDNNDGLATLYDGNGKKTPLNVTIPLPPGRVAPPAAAPTGMVWNSTRGFTITGNGTSAPAIFIFDTEDGTISAWNGPAVDPITPGTPATSTATLVVDNSHAGAVYKGLALGTNKNGNFLFATNFAAGTVEAYDSNFAPAKLDGNFTDPDIPAGFAPFGIHNIDNNLFVTYAKQNAQKNDVVAGAGLGFVDVFTTDGVFVRRFASGGVLNAPWGVVRATQKQGDFSGDILIGNFGSTGKFAGWINAFSAGANNDSHGPLLNEQGRPISIDGLWSLFFGTFLNSDADTLYFTAGPNNQTNGLFGSLVARVRTDADDLASK
jgi:uncharacterized protein (TIGR03118 family)